MMWLLECFVAPTQLCQPQLKRFDSFNTFHTHMMSHWQTAMQQVWNMHLYMCTIYRYHYIIPAQARLFQQHHLRQGSSVATNALRLPVALLTSDPQRVEGTTCPMPRLFLWKGLYWHKVIHLSSEMSKDLVQTCPNASGTWGIVT